MAKKIQLTIAEPCHENWDQMTAVDKGRFCGSCQKQVVDFSNMSDRQIALFFKKPSTGSVCGRFMQDQLDREMEIPKKRIPWVKYFFQLALPAFIASAKSNAQGVVSMGKPAIRTTMSLQPVKMIKGDTIIRSEVAGQSPACYGPITNLLNNREQKITIAQTVKPATTSFFLSMPALVGVAGFVSVVPAKQAQLNQIKGKVVDEYGEPIAFATVMIDGTSIGVQADMEGHFSIKPSKDWEKNELVISAVGFAQKKVFIDRMKSKEDMIVTLLSGPAMGEVVVVTGYTVIRTQEIMGAVSSGINIKPAKQADNKEMKPAMTDIRMEIYPNPMVSGGTLNIGCRNMEEGYYSLELLSLSGQLIRQRELWIDDKAVVLNMDMPSMAAGTYVLRLINKKSGKNFTEKVVVQ